MPVASLCEKSLFPVKLFNGYKVLSPKYVLSSLYKLNNGAVDLLGLLCARSKPVVPT